MCTRSAGLRLAFSSRSIDPFILYPDNSLGWMLLTQLLSRMLMAASRLPLESRIDELYSLLVRDCTDIECYCRVFYPMNFACNFDNILLGFFRTRLLPLLMRLILTLCPLLCTLEPVDKLFSMIRMPEVAGYEVSTERTCASKLR